MKLVIKLEAQQAMCTTVVKISANLSVTWTVNTLWSFSCFVLWFLPKLFINYYNRTKLVMKALIPVSPQAFSLWILCVCANYQHRFATPGLVFQIKINKTPVLSGWADHNLQLQYLILLGRLCLGPQRHLWKKSYSAELVFAKSWSMT